MPFAVLLPPNGPCTPTICCPAVNWAFIDKYQLVGLVLTYSGDIIQTFFGWAFCCNTCHLQGNSWLDPIKWQKWGTYLFHRKPSIAKHSPYCWSWNSLATCYRQHLLELVKIHVWVLTDTPKEKLGSYQQLIMRVKVKLLTSKSISRRWTPFFLRSFLCSIVPWSAKYWSMRRTDFCEMPV